MRLGIILKKLNQWKMSAGGAHIYIIGYMASGSQLLLHFTKLNQKKMNGGAGAYIIGYAESFYQIEPGDEWWCANIYIIGYMTSGS